MKSNKEVAEKMDTMSKDIGTKLNEALEQGNVAYLFLRKNDTKVYPFINLTCNMPKSETAYDPMKTLTTAYSTNNKDGIDNPNNDCELLKGLFKVLNIKSSLIHKLVPEYINQLTQTLLDGQHALIIEKDLNTYKTHIFTPNKENTDELQRLYYSGPFSRPFAPFYCGALNQKLDVAIITTMLMLNKEYCYNFSGAVGKNLNIVDDYKRIDDMNPNA